MGPMNASLKEHAANRPLATEVNGRANSLMSKDILKEKILALGSDLSRGILPRIQDGGIVTPGYPLIQPIPGVETKYVGTQAWSSATAPGVSGDLITV